MQKKENHKSIVPTAPIGKAAEKGLVLHEKFGRGGTSVGVARAHQLKNRESLSPNIVKRMHSYFARHEVDKKVPRFTDMKDPSNGYIAWLLWGGDAGKKWADSMVEKMNKADNSSQVKNTS